MQDDKSDKTPFSPMAFWSNGFSYGFGKVVETKAEPLQLGKPQVGTTVFTFTKRVLFDSLIIGVPCPDFLYIESCRVGPVDILIGERNDAFLHSPTQFPYHFAIVVSPEQPITIRWAYTGKRPPLHGPWWRRALRKLRLFLRMKQQSPDFLLVIGIKYTARGGLGPL